MIKIYVAVRHPKSYGGFSCFYEIVKSFVTHKEGKLFCENKNTHPNTRYHYAIKCLEVKTNYS